MELIVIGGTRLADHQRRRQKADPVEQRELHGYVKPRCKQEASTKRHPPAFFTPKPFLHSILLLVILFQRVLLTIFRSLFPIFCGATQQLTNGLGALITIAAVGDYSS